MYVAENSTDVQIDEEEDNAYVEYIDVKGNKKKVSEDELFYIQTLLERTGKEIDWDAFAEKNQQRIDRVYQVDDKIKKAQSELEQEKEKEKEQDQE